MSGKSPIRPTDSEARTLARHLIEDAHYGALGVIEPETGAPMVTRVAVGTDEGGRPVSLVSDLSAHTRALKDNRRCSLLLGEPGERGDPLTHPRLTVQARARFLPKSDPGYEALRQRWLGEHRKSTLYIDFPDFSFVVFEAEGAYLNGGFGKSFVLTPGDLRRK